MGSNNQPWPEERVNRLRELYFFIQDDKYFLSHGYIAQLMELPRTAVIGKLKRLKLSRDPKRPFLTSQGVVIDPQVTTFTRKAEPEKPVMTRVTNYPGKFSASKVTKPVRVSNGPGEYTGEVTATACQVLDLNDEKCRFPIGHVGYEGFHFCGDKVTTKPYCAYHAFICIVPAKPVARTVPSYNRT